MRFFEYARQASVESDFKVHVGCIAVYRGKVIATGGSSEKTSPVMARYNIYRHFEDNNSVAHKLHAEISVLNKIKKMDIDFSKVSLYVWRGNNGAMLSRPCPACMAAIKDIGIKHVFYSGYGTLVYEKILGKEVV